MMNKMYIPALDCVNIEEALRLVSATANIPEIYGYKIGFSLGLTYGLPILVKAIRAISDKKIIYDHQKAGTDIPDTGAMFANVLAGVVDEAIIFPQAGKATLLAWSKALQDRGIKVIIGGAMTHFGYIMADGGYLDDNAPYKIYIDAFGAGIRSFVVPLTKPNYCKFISSYSLEEFKVCDFYSPGFGAQGGDISQFDFVPNHKIIIGRSLLCSKDPAKYIQELLV
jgi:orotidine-5'-phosphate decarboxylase